MTKLGYEIKCLCCNGYREFELKEDNLFGDRIILTCWFCNDYHIILGEKGIEHVFRYDHSRNIYKDIKPIYRFKVIQEK